VTLPASPLLTALIPAPLLVDAASLLQLHLGACPCDGARPIAAEPSTIAIATDSSTITIAVTASPVALPLNPSSIAVTVAVTKASSALQESQPQPSLVVLNKRKAQAQTVY
jgi:hypothetical protein